MEIIWEYYILKKYDELKQNVMRLNGLKFIISIKYLDC